MEATKLELLHYKNAIFHGYICGLRKHGEAIVLLDNGSIIIGRFSNDQISGQCVIMLTPDTHFIGNFKQGLLDGHFAVRSPTLCAYAQARAGRVEGEILVIDRRQKRGRVWEIANEEGVCIREAEYDPYFSEDKIAKAIAPYTKLFPSLLEHFLLGSSSSRFSLKAMKGKERMDIAMEVRAARRLTIQLQRERVVGAGVMADGVLWGLGYSYDRANEVELQGELDRGQLHGQGVKRELLTGRTIYGRFSRGDIRSLDVLTDNNENADVSLNRLKKRVHIHSLEYTNDYINQRPIYLLRNFLESLARNERSYSQYKREQGRAPSEQPIPSRDPNGDPLSQDISEYHLINNALKGRQ